LLQGCDNLKAGAVLGYWWLTALLGTRPDRYMEFDIEIATRDGSIVPFKGEMRCVHSVTTMGPRYTALRDSVSAQINGQRWVLEGLTCDSVTKTNAKPTYNLYKISTEMLATVYFATAGGSAEVIKSDVRWGGFFGETSPPAPRKYSTGPFIYQKLYLKTIPSFARSISEPTLLFPHIDQCVSSHGVKHRSIKVAREDLEKLSGDSSNIRAIEDGVLRFDQLKDSWTPERSSPIDSPLDVAFKPGWDSHQFSTSCLVVTVAEGSAMLFRFGAGWVFNPSENSVLRVAPIRHGELLRYKDGERSQLMWL
jgi:hypothetical protein